jgi:hypothetical protein
MRQFSVWASALVKMAAWVLPVSAAASRRASVPASQSAAASAWVSASA